MEKKTVSKTGNWAYIFYRSVFSQGKLYVASSWQKKRENVKIALTETGKNSKHCAETGSRIK